MAKEDLLMLAFALLIICPNIFGALADSQLIYFALIFIVFSGT